jgi:hypothetical protein
LRDAFTRWGMPAWMRVDNGYPWGSKGDWPTDLALWLLGLGIHVWWNTPQRPEENGVVERSQGTGKRWSEPGQCADAAALQAQIDERDDVQRRLYPYREKKSRWEWYPGLAHSGRSYERSQEENLWDWQRVADHLSGYCVLRQVDQKGQISLYNRNHYVGVRHRQQPVWVMFHGAECQWVIADRQGRIFKSVAAPEVSRARILALEVANRR